MELKNFMNAIGFKTFADIFNQPANPNPFRSPSPFHGGKHQASKRGHKHAHKMSKGERRHAAYKS